MANVSYLNRVGHAPYPANGVLPTTYVVSAGGAFVDLPGLKSATLTLPAFTAIKDTDQQSPNAAHAFVAGLAAPVAGTLRFGHSKPVVDALVLATPPFLVAAAPGPNQYAVPAAAAAAAEWAAYAAVLAAGGRRAFEFTDIRGVKYRTLGILNLGEVEKGEDDIEVLTCQFQGSGMWLVIAPPG